MNYAIREVLKTKDITKDCDFLAINNNNETYFILSNRNGSAKGIVTIDVYKQELVESSHPIVLSSSLFNKKTVSRHI